jgi:hypothetical protein
MIIVRPCTVFGPNVDTISCGCGRSSAFAIDVGNLDNQVQFVHEDDVVEAIARLLLGRHEGPFNLAGDGVMTLRECAATIGMPIRRLPLRAYRGLARLMWTLRFVEAPPGSIDFYLDPWVMSNEKLKRTLDWTPRYTSRETFEITRLGSARVEASAGAAPLAGGRADAPRGERLGRRRRRRRAAARGRFSGTGLSRAEAYGPQADDRPGLPLVPALERRPDRAQHVLQGGAAVDPVRSPTCANHPER